MSDSRTGRIETDRPFSESKSSRRLFLLGSSRQSPPTTTLGLGSCSSSPLPAVAFDVKRIKRRGRRMQCRVAVGCGLPPPATGQSNDDEIRMVSSSACVSASPSSASGQGDGDPPPPLVTHANILGSSASLSGEWFGPNCGKAFAFGRIKDAAAVASVDAAGGQARHRSPPEIWCSWSWWSLSTAGPGCNANAGVQLKLRVKCQQLANAAGGLVCSLLDGSRFPDRK